MSRNIFYPMIVCLFAVFLSGCFSKSNSCQPYSISSPSTAIPPKKIFLCDANLSSNDYLRNLQKSGATVSTYHDKIVILIPIGNVFEPNSATISRDGNALLEDLFSYLKPLQNTSVDIGCHEDNLFNVPDNQQLTEDQAVKIQGFLWAQGFPNKTLNQKAVFNGYGSSQPIASNTEIEGMGMNRRIEITVMEK